jgi:MoaA/NifB/PqqE/SkfB family radical SAM enzyme
MKLFSSVALEISAVCNRACTFCPNAYNKRPDEQMSWQLLEKAAAELRALSYRGRIEFYIYNEPCRDMEWLLKAIRYFREVVPKACLMIATNGDYLRGPKSIDALWAAGLNQLVINCYSPGLYAKRLQWLDGQPQGRPLYAYISPRVRSVAMFDKSTIVGFGNNVFQIQNRAGNIAPYRQPVMKPLERMCVKPFRFFNIDWCGHALICCNDYHAAHSFGNLNDSTLVQLWNHPMLNTYRRELVKKNRNTPMCKTCDCPSGARPYYITSSEGPYVKELK